MSLLSRREDDGGPDYDETGRILGGLSALEQLAHVVSAGDNETTNVSQSNSEDSGINPATELPIHSSPNLSHFLSSPSVNSEDSFSGASNDSKSSDDSLQDIELDQAAQPISGISRGDSVEPRETISEGDKSATARRSFSRSRSRSRPPRRSGSSLGRRSARSIGEQFKFELVQVNIMLSLLDLFFEFPWNNILHSVIYDFIHQVLTGRTDSIDGQELVVSLFRDARLAYRILEGHNENMKSSRSTITPQSTRLGYMGHLTLITDDILTALEHLPSELSSRVRDFLPQPAWDEYIRGDFTETKRKDSSLLGGGKPAVNTLLRAGGLDGIRWSRLDEQIKSHPQPSPNPVPSRGQFKRAETLSHPLRETSANFMDTPFIEPQSDISKHNQFAHYLASEMSSESRFGGSMDDNSDDDEEDAGWLSQSQFDLRTATEMNGDHGLGLSPSRGFDDEFNPVLDSMSHGEVEETGVEYYEDGDLGPFSDSSAVREQVTVGSQLREMDSSFETFGDFGEFQEAEDGEITPTENSWTWDAGDLPSRPKTHSPVPPDKSVSASEAVAGLTLEDISVQESTTC